MSGWTNWQILVYLLSNVFYSKLKQCNVLDVEHENYGKLLRQGLYSSTALKRLKMQTIPKSGIEIYKELQQTWVDEKWNTFRDFLIRYNNKEVVPTLQAIQSMMKLYHDQHIDIMKLK